MQKSILFALLLFYACLLKAQQLPEGFEMGKPVDQWKQFTTDISNPESWEETKFKYNQLVTYKGFSSQNTEITFWNNRLYAISLTLDKDHWKDLKSIFDKEYGKAWTEDTTSGKIWIQWGEEKNRVWLHEFYDKIIVEFSDETQKEFHASDLLHGILFYIIITIIGLFIVYYTIAWLLTSWCKGCKTFNMKLQPGVEISNAKDYSTDFFTKNIQHDRTYKYKCSKCGSMRKDRYSGFWEARRN